MLKILVFLIHQSKKKKKISVFSYFRKKFHLRWYRVQGSEAATGVLWKKVFLEISQNSQESACARVSFLTKLQSWGLQIY